MAIEIRELHIKAVIDSGKSGGKKESTAGDASNPSAPDQIVDLCVEKVLEILREKKER